MPDLTKVPSKQGSIAPNGAEKRCAYESARILLLESGITGLGSISRIITEDVGTPVEIRPEQGALSEPIQLNITPELKGWLVLECLPGPSDDIHRARVFKSLEGALVEFCTKVDLHRGQEAVALDLQIPPQLLNPKDGRALQITFTAPGRRMVLAPAEEATTAASQMLAI